MKIVTPIVFLFALIAPINADLTFWEHLADQMWWGNMRAWYKILPRFRTETPEVYFSFLYPRRERPYMPERPQNYDLLQSFTDLDWSICAVLYLQRYDYLWFGYWFQFRNEEVAIERWTGMQDLEAFYSKLVPALYDLQVISLRETILVYRHLTDKEFQKLGDKIRDNMLNIQSFNRLLRGFRENGMSTKANILCKRLKV